MIENIQLQKFATKRKFKLNKPNKKSQKNNWVFKTKCEKYTMECIQNDNKILSTDINKVNLRFNHILLVFTNQNFYCGMQTCSVFKTSFSEKTVSLNGKDEHVHLFKIASFSSDFVRLHHAISFFALCLNCQFKLVVYYNINSVICFQRALLKCNGFYEASRNRNLAEKYVCNIFVLGVIMFNN